MPVDGGRQPPGRELPRFAALGKLGSVCRLGLATRGESSLGADDVREALRRGVDLLNWCGEGHVDGLCHAVRRLGGEERRKVVVAAQFAARTAREARSELKEILGALGTPYVDVLTYYYVEREEEWREIVAASGAAAVLEEARAAGVVRALGVTGHQRPLLAAIARSGRVDLVMARYNAAHRGAEEALFPVTAAVGLPVVAYTALRWGDLLRPTPDDPAGFAPPSPAECYRFVLAHPAVTAALMAPANAAELEADLRLLDDWRGLEPGRDAALRAHGDRVRRHAPSFP